jgi:hypothetical protein
MLHQHMNYFRAYFTTSPSEPCCDKHDSCVHIPDISAICTPSYVLDHTAMHAFLNYFYFHAQYSFPPFVRIAEEEKGEPGVPNIWGMLKPYDYDSDEDDDDLWLTTDDFHKQCTNGENTVTQRNVVLALGMYFDATGFMERCDEVLKWIAQHAWPSRELDEYRIQRMLVAAHFYKLVNTKAYLLEFYKSEVNDILLSELFDKATGKGAQSVLPSDLLTELYENSKPAKKQRVE